MASAFDDKYVSHTKKPKTIESHALQRFLLLSLWAKIDWKYDLRQPLCNVYW